MRIALFALLLAAQSAFATTTVPLQLTFAEVGVTNLCGFQVGAQPITNATKSSAGIASLDASGVVVTYRGYEACGRSGRGSSLTYYYWCLQGTWDLSGNLISLVAIEPPTYAGYQACPLPNSSASFEWNGYEALTEISARYGHAYYVPELLAP